MPYKSEDALSGQEITSYTFMFGFKYLDNEFLKLLEVQIKKMISLQNSIFVEKSSNCNQ